MYPTPLPLAADRAAVALDEPFGPDAGHDPDARADDLVREALALLADDPAAAKAGSRPGAVDGIDDDAARRLLRSLLTVRAPGPLSAPRPPGCWTPSWPTNAWHATSPMRPRCPPSSTRCPMPPTTPLTVRCCGRATSTLGADAVVNAANSALLGCFRPMHPCIDNALHTAAGPRLRDDCHTIMSLQRHPEPTGTAKITRGHHLAARYVLHTVGPIVDGPVLPQHQQALAPSYRACLDLAAEAAASAASLSAASAPASSATPSCPPHGPH
nr:macro domain-containing protein [Streptomyces canus]